MQPETLKIKSMVVAPLRATLLNIYLSLHYTFYRLNASQSYFPEVQGHI